MFFKSKSHGRRPWEKKIYTSKENGLLRGELRHMND